MSHPKPGSQAWLDQVVEPIVDPERVIVDPHHHFWHHERFPYLLENLWMDTSSGHRVEQTVFVECASSYRSEGPEHLRPVGETEFVAEIAAASQRGEPGRAVVSGIVSYANLTLGEQLEEVLNAHEQAGQGLFRGIRHDAAVSPLPREYKLFGRAPEGLYFDASFRRGVKRLGELGYVYDAWNYAHQNADFAELARAVPDTTLVFDHFGTPLGIGPYADKRDEIFEQLKKDIAKIARCPNVVAKIGGLAMTFNGFGWHTRERPASSDEFVEAQRRYYLHTIECFGPQRCMFESNYPMDRRSISYHVLWNGFKKMVSDFSETEKDAMFSGTARAVYRL